MDYVIFTDTSANLPDKVVREYGLRQIPFFYCPPEHPEGIPCPGSEEFDGSAYYNAIRRGAVVTTSQINVHQYVNAMDPVLEAGHDILFVGMSSGISGAYHCATQAAHILSEQYPERRIRTVDTLSASLGEGLLVIEAAKMRDAGVGLDEVADRLNSLRMRMGQIFTVDDLFCLKRGGRLSGAAALLGTVTPFCSCSSIPLFIGFTSAGLPLGVTFSFLISSPMVDLGSLVLLMSIFGAKVAVAYVLLGLVVAVAGGNLIEKLHLEQEVEPFIRNAGKSVEIDAPAPTQKERLRSAWEQMTSTLRKVFPFILLGVGVGAVIHNWIPQAWVETVLGGKNPFSVVLATIVGIPLYADIFGTIPIAEALLSKGAQLGTVLSFMMGVTTLSLPSLVMLRKAVKPKLLAAFLGICTLGILLVGFLFNALQFLFV